MPVQPSIPSLSQKPRQQWLNLLCLFAMAALGLYGLYCLRSPDRIQRLGLWVIVSAGILGTWRWSWFGLHVLRSRIYLHWVFPRWRRRANRLAIEDIPSIGIVVPTFREHPWITQQVFAAIAHEAQTLSQPLTLVAVTTPEEIIDIERILRSVDPDLSRIEYIPLLDPAGGKRKALAVGLRALAKMDSPPEIVCLMDGDSIISEGGIRKCLPFFKLFPKLGGLTTDERASVIGSKSFAEWLELRFAQRHFYMCSHALSHKVLCLTGRYSLYRAEAALDPTFAQLLENDTLQDWLWGEFKFLSGDDKSTWYWLLERNYDMLYVPDVMVETIETVSGNIPLRMYQNMRRWFGNMLRNGSRALALGPKRVGWYPWYCLLDQRLSFWTSLVTPGLLLIYLVSWNSTGVGLILSWLLFTRSLSLLALGWGREVNLKPIHVLQTVLSQWGSSLVKIYTQMNLAQQKWSNRGNQSRSAAGTGLERWLKLGTARFLLTAQGFSFAIVLLCLAGFLVPHTDLPAWWWRLGNNVIAQPVQIVQAVDYGVKPDDDVDDARALQQILNQLPTQGLIQIELPPGELLLCHRLTLHRSHTVINGEGQGRTILRVSGAKSSEFVPITIAPQPGASPIEQIKLSHFTLLQTSSAGTAIVIRNADHASLNNLQFQGSGAQALTLQGTKAARLDYLAFDGKYTRSPITWLNANNNSRGVILSANPAK
ncbi:MAG: glycosyltransferase [Leptolyngbyaceae cyanobacterium RU_5_1]|nr:glycosyltransferase [Leptolyngbyaceae cyanobacterium RU_5_1]